MCAVTTAGPRPDGTPRSPRFGSGSRSAADPFTRSPPLTRPTKIWARSANWSSFSAERISCTARLELPARSRCPASPCWPAAGTLLPTHAEPSCWGCAAPEGDDATGGLDEIAGTTGTLIVLGDELADQSEDFGARAELFVYLGAHPAPAAASAHFVLPVTTFAEQEGTFTNVQGRVQHFGPALRASGDVQPAWLVLSSLAAALSGEAAPASAAEAFARLAARVPGYEELDYERIGALGALAGSHAAVAGDR